MAVRKSQQKCVNKYIDGHYDRINLTVTKGKKDIIKEAAQAKGESVNTFINRLIDSELKAMGRGFSFADGGTEKTD